jgi:hypothetical protein
MKMNLRNIELIMDVLQFAIDHYGQTFMDEDVYKACPKATSNIIELLIEREVITSTKDGCWFDECNIDKYKSFLSDLKDEIDELKISEKEKKYIQSKIRPHFNMNINLLNIDVGL